MADPIQPPSDSTDGIQISEDNARRYANEAIRLLRRELEQLREELRQDMREMHTKAVRPVLDLLREIDIGQRRNLQQAMERASVQESADLVQRNMSTATAFSHPHETLRHALSLAPTGGLALEFGVYSGTTLGIIAATRNDAKVFGFDSFQGLPEAWRTGFPSGAFSSATLPEVRGAELVVGWFDATLPQFLRDHPDPVDFLHIDCDLYSSTRTVLELVGPRLRTGSVLVFDEYFNYPGWKEHEFKAWSEYVERTGSRFTYEAYTFNNEQVALRLTAL